MPWPKGKKRSKETIEQIKAYRKTQKPPNLKHGKYTKEKLEEERKSKILRLFVNPRKQEVQDQAIVSTFGTYNKIANIPLNSVIDFKRNTEVWSSISPVNLQLDVTESTLARKITEVEQQWARVQEPATDEEEFERAKIYARVNHLSRIYEDLGRKLLGRKVVVFNRLFSKSGRKPLDQQKNWPYFLRLHAILNMLNLRSDEDIRLYITGVWEGLRFPISVSVGFIPLKQLGSYRCVWYFLKFLDTQREAYSGVTTSSTKRAMDTRYKANADNTLAANALSWCQYIIYNATEPSRVANEIPFAFSSEDFTVLYCYSNKYIRTLWKKGGLKQEPWLKFNEAMLDFHQRIQKEPHLKQVVRTVIRKSTQLWKRSGIPSRSPDDKTLILRDFEDSPKAQSILKQIL